MARQPNTTRTGGSFDRATIMAVWEKATPVLGYNPNEFRKDRCGAWIQFSAYGSTSLVRGWEIDHDRPVAKGGGDEFSNLQPLHWQNNRHKSDNWPYWECRVQV